jgi:signal recognition particle receptor subunit beta
VIFVVDSSDRDRMEEAAEEFQKVCCQEELQEIPILVLANKQDKEDKMTLEEIAKVLELEDVKDHKINIFPTTATKKEKDDGLEDALEWLVEMISKK